METQRGLGVQQVTCGEGALQGGEQRAPPAICLPPFHTAAVVIPALQAAK